MTTKALATKNNTPDAALGELDSARSSWKLKGTSGRSTKKPISRCAANNHSEKAFVYTVACADSIPRSASRYRPLVPSSAAPIKTTV